jgi:hypothetical protein
MHLYPSPFTTAAAAGSTGQPKWIAANDEHGNTYYYNNETGECQWEKPADFDGNRTSVDQCDSQKLDLIRKAFEGKLKKLGFGDSENLDKVNKAKREQKEAHEKRIAAGANQWVEVYDPASDAFYYVIPDHFHNFNAIIDVEYV